MRKAASFNRPSNNWEAKTLAVVDRTKLRSSLNWLKDIRGVGKNFESIKQLSNHTLLLDVKKQDEKYVCYFTSVTSETAAVPLINGKHVGLSEVKLSNGESRYIPKVIYKYTFEKSEFSGLLNLENSRSENLINKIKWWEDNHHILKNWLNIVKYNEFQYINLDLIEETGKLDLGIGIFTGKLSEDSLDVEEIKRRLNNEEL